MFKRNNDNGASGVIVALKKKIQYYGIIISIVHCLCIMAVCFFFHCDIPLRGNKNKM